MLLFLENIEKKTDCAWELQTCYLMATVPGFPGGSDGEESICNSGELDLIPGLGRPPGERNGLPIPVFLPREFHGQRSLVGYGPWGCKESYTTEQLTH